MIKNESPKAKEIKELRDKELNKEATDVRKIDLSTRNKKKKVKKVKKKEEQEFEQKIIDLARVTRVMAGGKRMRFRAAVIVGDKKGRVGLGVAKGADVTLAVNKAVLKAKKNLITVNIVKDTIPYTVRNKFKASQIIIKPASAGTGIIAGGAVRSVLEMANIPNVVSKTLGGSNKINNIVCTINALKKLDLVKSKSKKAKNEAIEAKAVKSVSVSEDEENESDK